MGGSAGQIVRSAVDPIGLVGGGKYSLLGLTGNAESSVAGQLYDKPRRLAEEAAKKMHALSDQQAAENAKLQAEQKAKDQQAKKMKADLARGFSNNAAARANFSYTRGGTILTGPLGQPSDATIGGRKSALGA